MYNFDENARFIFDDSLKGMGFVQDRTCQKCGMTLSDVMKSEIVGCAVCYKTFENEIRTILLKRMGTINNVGKIPVKHFSKVKLKEKINELEVQKEQAIKDENFIMAESLKNQIEKLKGELANERL